MTEREMARRKAAARKERKARARKQRNRRVLMTVALMLVVCVASIGGTIAWLTDKTESVTNTFSPSNIDIWMTETVKNADGTSTVQSTQNGQSITNPGLQIVPGLDIPKDPKVSATGDVPYYVFVQVTATHWPDYKDGTGDAAVNKVNYVIAAGWTKLEEGVYYRTMPNGGDLDASVLANDEVTVSNTLTKEELNAMGTPSLSFKAYAIQMQNSNDTTFTPEVAWTTLNS